MRYLNSLFMVAAVLLLLAGCDSSATMNGSTNLTLNLKPEVNGSELSARSSATYDVNGATISFTSARMYLSEITLLESESISYTTDGEHITVPAKNDEDEDISHTVRDKIVLVKQDAGVNLYDLGAWPSGEYEGIRFKVGIAGTTNRIDPSQVPAEHPLSKQSDRNNHWNWNAGYLFLRIDGKVDVDNDGTPDDDWAVHLGTERFLKEVTLMQNFTLEEDSDATLDISINYGAFLENVDLTDPDQRICHTMNNMPVARAVAEQIPSAYRLEGVR
ncbi:MAG: hypothetical protein OXI44_12405 [Bacteroidota bacterium]|nr:hypothetical protein [Bacteroidota bacterium]